MCILNDEQHGGKRLCSILSVLHNTFINSDLGWKFVENNQHKSC